MSLKSAVIVEIKANDNVYQFHMPVGVPLGEAYDAAFQVLNEIIELSKKAADQLKQAPAEESAPSTEVKPDAIN